MCKWVEAAGHVVVPPGRVPKSDLNLIYIIKDASQSERVEYNDVCEFKTR